MAEIKTYAEKLKSPHWQRRRLEIMSRDNFTCQKCGDKESPLNVHHKRYSGGHPANSPDKDLITWCEKCHKNEHFPPVIEQEPIEVRLFEGLSLGTIAYMCPFWRATITEGTETPPADLLAIIKEKNAVLESLRQDLSEQESTDAVLRFMELQILIKEYGKEVANG